MAMMHCQGKGVLVPHVATSPCTSRMLKYTLDCCLGKDIHTLQSEDLTTLLLCIQMPLHRWSSAHRMISSDVLRLTQDMLFHK